MKETERLPPSTDFLAILKKSGSKDILLQFVELSNVHNSDRNSKPLGQTSCIKIYKTIGQSRLFVE